MGQKRKTSSPEPKSTRLKLLKRVVRSKSPARKRLRLSPKKRLPITPTKQKLRKGAKHLQSTRRQSPRFKCQNRITSSDHNGAENQQSSSPLSSPFQSEEDTEPGLVITLDEELRKIRKQTRKKNGRRPKTASTDRKEEEEEKKEEEKPGKDSECKTDREGGEEQSDDDCGKLDRDLERKSRQLNLTAVNVRDILHEVITNEHVVAMMKAAIMETQDMPLFEPKMTRSKLKEVVEKGEGSPTWIKKSKEVKPPQFVDIPLEEDEDSSDEEYCPDEDEEDETAEDTFQESDVDSTASSPRVSRAGRARTPVEHSEGDEEKHHSPRLRPKTSKYLRMAAVPMGPPPPPQSCSSPRATGPPDCSFLEKLHAVDEELALSHICLEPFQALSSAGGAECANDSLVSCRTRSKRPLRGIPLGMLEAELHAPDITPDMYDCGLALEDRDWSEWLQGLMISDIEYEEEGDDEDDPEYNFLDDLDEPDREDYRTDRAVRITKREVNGLMEELFDTFQDELGCREQDEEGRDEDEERDGEPPPPTAPNFNVPQAIRFEEPLAKMLTACRRTVMGQQDSPPQSKESQPRVSHNAPVPQVLLIPPPCTLVLSGAQKRRLQQQVQQHVQLLTQVNMLSAPVEALHSDAVTTKMYLSELQSFAERGEQMRAAVQPGFVSAFRACNLQPSLELLEELKNTPSILTPLAKPLRSHSAVLPPKLAWLLATRPVFLYPELLPRCSLDPALQTTPCKVTFTKGEDGLIVLGLKHLKDTEVPHHLICRYLLRNKKTENLRTHIQDLCVPRAMDNVIKDYFKHNVVPPLQLACVPVLPGEERPPVERKETLFPHWLKKSLPHIHRAVLEYNKLLEPASPEKTRISPPYIFPKDIRYPPSMPENLTLHMHPLGKHQAPNSKSKVKPFRAFSCSSLAPLAKAPTHSTGIPSLARIQGQAPSQGIILLANAPFQGALPMAQAMLTPAHGTVPVNTHGPVNLQPFTRCIVQGSGPRNAAVGFPTGIIQIPNTPSLGAPVFRQGVLTYMAPPTQKPTKKRNPPKRNLLQKLLPIQPAPLKQAPQLPQLLSISAEHGVRVLSVKSLDAEAAPLTGEERVNEGLDAVHNPSSAMPVTTISLQSPNGDSLVTSNEVLVETSTASLFVSESISDQPQDLATALLPILSTLDPSQIALPTPPDSSVHLKAGQMFFSHNPSSPLVASTGGKTSPDIPRVDDHEQTRNHTGGSRREILCSPPATPTLQGGSPQNSDQASSSDATNCSVHQSTAHTNTAVMTSTINIGYHNSLNSVSQQGSQLVTSESASQFFLVPQNCLLANGPTVQSIGNGVSLTKEVPNIPPLTKIIEPQTNGDFQPGNSVQSPNEGPSTDNALREVREGMVKLIEGIKEWDDQQLQRQEEETEETGVDQWGEEEEEDGGCMGDPLLTLSESTGSPVSSLDSHSDAMERMTESEEELGLPMAEHRQEVHSHPQLLALTAGTEDKPSGESNGNSEGRENGNGEEQQNGREGSGGEKHGNEDGEQNGGRRSEGGEQDGAGDKNGEGADGDGEKDGDGDRDRPGEEEEEEDFDDLTQDEDEEEVMSSASEESVLSVPELQETMEKLTWLASERRLCGEGDSEEDNSPTSPNSPVSQNSQEEISEEEEEGAVKGEEMELGDGGASKLPEGDAPQEEDGPPQASGKGAGRGRGRGRPPPRSLKRNRRQERCSKDTAKLLLLYDDQILDNDPMRESKDFAFAQAYLNRVRETLQEVPGKVEEVLCLLYEFEQSAKAGEARSAVELFSQLKPVLREWPDLLQDFAAFLLPEQALECGLFKEQQAFERSRRFLRQLEISFGENPSHYQKIVRALQSGPGLSPAGVDELKQQMATLLKGHTHLQGEFCLFFDGLRPPPARPGQFEEASWPEDDGGEGIGQGSGVVANRGFEEVTLPDLEEEEEVHKIPPMAARSRRRKELGRHRNYKACDWPEKDCPCSCHDTAHDPKLRKHRRKGCSHCHSNKASDVSKVKSPDATVTSPTAGTPSDRGGEETEEGKDMDLDIKDEIGSGASSPHHDQGCPTWDGSEGDPHPITEGREEDEEEEDEEEEWREGDAEQGLTPRKRIRTEESLAVGDKSPTPPCGESNTPPQPRPSPTSDTPVCAKNISLTPSGEKVILWTREADRVILTTCQQQGASQSTFQAISAELGNKTASEISRRFRDLMRLFHTSARQASSEDEASNPEHHSATDEEQD
ncbi:GON-4-like protein [Clupea harengus]|uniref:GON-4-like protein n=1 Tax=Clupea harengus TaxID=7950 RepID=A0A6P8G7V4_CLUHA|nr:GON-4-like protein [Clupea harengus]XP_031431687.1 GON-4-like protein [Clupea harengus]